MGNSEWTTRPFTEAVMVNPAVTLTKGKVYPFVEMAAVDPTTRSVSESEHREFTGGGARFLPGDTLMARITPCLENGKIARFQPTDKTSPGFGSTEFIVIRGREGVTDNDFAYYLTKWSEFHQFAVAQMTGTSGRQRVPAESLSGFKATIPPPDIQANIAHILGTLDDKIELNRRMNRTLEKMAAAIFKSWFIDFDPVRRNAARTQNQPSPKPSPNGRGSGNYRGGYDFAGLVETARAMRKNPTDAEALFWELVRDRRFLGLKFRRQHQLGDYVADFYCHEYRLVVELDGGVHRTKQKKDLKRDAWMVSQGFKVLRIRNEQLLDDPAFVLEQIAEIISSPSPSGRRAGDEGCVETFDALFPDTFEDSELGEIPKGWRLGTLGDIADNPRRTVQPSDVPPATPYVGLQHMPRRCIAMDAWGRADEVSSGKSQFKEGEILFGKLRPYFHKVGIAPVGGVCSTDILVVAPRSTEWHSHVLSLVSSKAFVDYADSHSAGTKMPRTNWKDMGRYPLAMPPVPLAKAFQDHVAALHQRIGVAVRQNRRLAGLRDTLIPKLLSGELELPAAEAVVEEVS
jgi:type I restriction enzyme S subunit